MPTDSIYTWDNTAKQWVTTLAQKQQWIRPIRDPELSRTDKYMLSDWQTKFTADQQSQIATYRQALRDAPDQPTIEQIVMPPCPAFIAP
jgi:hypothetical protein